MDILAARALVWSALRQHIVEASDIAKVAPLPVWVVERILHRFERDELVHPIQVGGTVHWMLGPAEDPEFNLRKYIEDALLGGGQTVEQLTEGAPVALELATVAKELAHALREGSIQPAAPSNRMAFQLS